MKKSIFLLMACALTALAVQAQVAQDSAKVYYRRGYSQVDPALRNNRAELDRFTEAIKRAAAHDAVEGIVIRSYASPDGTNRANERLARLRAENLKKYIVEATGVDGSLIEQHPDGIAWDGLRAMLEASDLEWKEEAIAILDTVPVFIYDERGIPIDGRNKRLMDLRGGRPYNYMLEVYFPDLRSSVAATLFIKEEKAEELKEEEKATPAPTPAVTEEKPVSTVEEEITPEPEETAEADTTAKPLPVPEEEEEEEEKPDFTPIIGIKTNLLYWATIMPDFHSYTFVPNLEVEWYFAKRWSLSAQGNFALWDYNGGDWFGVSSWSIEPRWWIWGDSKFRWIYLGVYGQVGDYDVQNDRVDRDGNTGKMWGAGLSVGAVIPFTQRWGCEIGIRAGYRNAIVRAYSYEAPDYFLDYQTTDNHWGVTGIKASIYYRIGKNNNK